MEIFVVSSDREVLQQAAAEGANLLGEGVDKGVNAAVNLALDMTSEACRWLIIPSDIPFLEADDIRRVLELGKRARVVIAPSREMSGTNLLLMGRDSRIPLSYDDDSFWNHLKNAARRGLRVAIYARMTAMLDLDSTPDLQAALRMNVTNETTRFLRRALRRKRKVGGRK